MENKKSKGGAEKARVKKRKALETDAARCAKIGSFFKTSTRSETTNDEMLNKMQLYLHVVTLSTTGSAVGSRFSLRKREPTPQPRFQRRREEGDGGGCSPSRGQAQPRFAPRPDRARSQSLSRSYGSDLPTSLTPLIPSCQRLVTLETCCGYGYNMAL